MKKIISLAMCLVLGSFVLAGCSNNSEPFEEKSYTPDTQVSEISLDVQDRAIDVSLSEDDQIHIQYSENSKEYYEISVSDEHVLTMTSASDKEWTDYVGTKTSAEHRVISLQVPDALLEHLTLSTTNEDISLPALTVKNGDIAGTVMGSYDDFAIQSELKKGESNLPERKDGGEKTLTVSSNNGDVSIEFASE